MTWIPTCSDFSTTSFMISGSMAPWSMSSPLVLALRPAIGHLYSQLGCRLERVIRELVAAKDYQRVGAVLDQLCNEYAYAVHQPHARNGGLIGLAAAAIALGSVSLQVSFEPRRFALVFPIPYSASPSEGASHPPPTCSPPCGTPSMYLRPSLSCKGTTEVS